MVIIPAHNEAASLRALLPRLLDAEPGQVVVADNASTDDTAEVVSELARQTTTTVVTLAQELRLGYGAACSAGIDRVQRERDIVVFMDADSSDEPRRLAALVRPIATGAADLVIGCRVRRLQEAGAMTPPQRFGNWLATRLIRLRWGHRYHDLGPFRAIHKPALDAIGMRDRAFGWTVEMQVRALQVGLRVLEVPVPYARRRVGRNKISGTVRGVVLAGYYILSTIGRLALTRANPSGYTREEEQHTVRPAKSDRISEDSR